MCDTMRVPGFSALSAGARRALGLGRRYMAMTVAADRSVVNRSCWRKVTRSLTPAASAFARASAMRKGSSSIPTPRAAPKSLTAAIGMRPSPEPRSNTMSPVVTCAVVSIAFTTTSGVGTSITSSGFACCAAPAAARAADIAPLVAMHATATTTTSV